MSNPFFEHPILNSPYAYPARHWELDKDGQPTQQIIANRRLAEFITPIPKPRKRKKAAEQQDIVFDEGKGLSTEAQQYDPTPIINELRSYVDQWRALPNPNDWQVTPRNRTVLQHWRDHKFNDIRPFFCQIEAAETAIWLSEVAPTLKAGKKFLDHLSNANNDANPELMRLALKTSDRRRQNYGDGHANRMANRKCSSPPEHEEVHARVFSRHPWNHHKRSLACLAA